MVMTGNPPAAPASTVTTSGSLRELIGGAIDYAGLFPPAQRDMDTAVSAYAFYCGGDDAWMLGRFVVPAGRLGELHASMEATRTRGFAVSAVLGDDAAADLAAVLDFNRRMPSEVAFVDSVEARADSIARIEELAGRVHGRYDLYVELPIRRDLDALLAAVRGEGLRAKIRTGGVTVDAFPPPTSVVRFVQACVAANVTFKATAGLHHPLTGAYPLTYDRDAACASMYGFLNVLLASAFLHDGMSAGDAAALLEEQDAGAIAFTDAGASWRGRHLSADAIASTRERLFDSFGSCSFREPVDSLRGLRLVP